jgi:hypothetical protein
MKTLDILMPAQRHASSISRCIDEFAGFRDSEQLTEAAATWGKLIAHAVAICELEYPMRIILMQEAALKETQRNQPKVTE